jgi:hypothetical protein
MIHSKYAQIIDNRLPNAIANAVLRQIYDGNQKRPKSTVENAVLWEDIVKKERILRIPDCFLKAVPDYWITGADLFVCICSNSRHYNETTTNNLRRLI